MANAGFICEVRRRNPSSVINTVMTNENHVAAHGVEPRSIRDIRSTFVSIRQFYFEVHAGKPTSHANNRANV